MDKNAKGDGVKKITLIIVAVALIIGGVLILFGRQQQLSQPELPINISVRKALLGSGQVARFQNLGTTDLVVAVTVNSPATNQQKSWRLVMPPGKVEEIGHFQGWNFVTGDEIEVSENGFRPQKVRIP